MVEYDVLGNERHKAVCKLREMPSLYPNKDGGADLYAWKSALADAIGADTELFSAIRDRLIYLLGGDQPKFSELFGILREDDDGVDARPSDSASADSPDHGALGVFVREGNDYIWYNAEFLHHHVPTVEDVLTEMFAKAIERGELTNGAAQTIAEYAAKLKLADA